MYKNCNKDKENQTKDPTVFPQKRFNEKPCRVCDEIFHPYAPSELYCSDDCRNVASSDKYLKRTYGISLEGFNMMYEKCEGRCEICGSEGFVLNESSRMKLALDHDHNTGQVRGFLCHNCNRALGLLKDSIDNLEEAIKYLKRATTISKESTLKQVEAQGNQETD